MCPLLGVLCGISVHRISVLRISVLRISVLHISVLRISVLRISVVSCSSPCDDFGLPAILKFVAVCSVVAVLRGLEIWHFTKQQAEKGRAEFLRQFGRVV